MTFERMLAVLTTSALAATAATALAQTPGELFPAKPAKTPPAAAPAPAPATAPTRIVAGAVVSGTAQALVKAPVPDDVRREGTLLDLRQAYRADYSDHSPAARKALAQKLLTRARGLRNDVSTLRFVLYSEAAKLLALAGDQEGSRAAIDELAALYDINAEQELCKTFDALAPQSRTPEERKSLAYAYAALVGPALARDDYVNAPRYNTRAFNMARAAGDAALASALEARGNDLKELQEEFPRVLAARKVLAQNPADASANALVGRFDALLKGDFDTGLPELARSDAPGLKDLAAKDLSLQSVEPKDALRLVDLGDSWREAAGKMSALARKNALIRARTAYERFLAENAKFAEQVRAAKTKLDAELPPPIKIDKR